MPHERPPVIDAEYRVVHGPWPRWMLHIALVKLGLWTAGIVLTCVLITLAVLWGLNLLF
ncbi:hypothetical protein [Phenylobacterium deserti]|uniref:hypothetical protein n=1 Tax=Phenylobacterium deserti TaxID=1914756 RepID=UPI001402C6CE|nr:hypothetical protein [Phenylobacterium deserti]